MFLFVYKWIAKEVQESYTPGTRIINFQNITISSYYGTRICNNVCLYLIDYYCTRISVYL